MTTNAGAGGYARVAPANRKVVDVFLAQGEGGGGGSGLVTLLMIVGLFAIFYFLLIRPQQKRRRDAMQMQSTLAEGDEVVTIGGLHGTIAERDDETRTVILETSEGVFSRYDMGAIGRKVNHPEPAAEAGPAESETSSADSVIEHRDKD